MDVGTVVPTTLHFASPQDGRRERTADGTMRHAMMPAPMQRITGGKATLHVGQGILAVLSTPDPMLEPLRTTAYASASDIMPSWGHGDLLTTVDPELVVPLGGFPDEGEVVRGTAAFSSGVAQTVGRGGQTLNRALRLWWRLPEAVSEANPFGLVSHMPACELCTSEFLVQQRAGRSHAEMLVTPTP